jgi:hypothetical protein
VILVVVLAMGTAVTSLTEDALKPFRISEHVVVPVDVGRAAAWATVFDAPLVAAVKVVVSFAVNTISIRRSRVRG